MGGAERTARRRRQQQASGARNAVASARSNKPDRIKLVVGAVLAVLIAAFVVGGVLLTNASKKETEERGVAVAQSAADYPVRRDGGVVVAGKDDAKVTLDVYEDFLCPGCGSFEKRDSDTIEQKLTAGTLRIRYHMLPMLNNLSDPPGYSLDAANAALAAADAGRFPAFHKSLFADQPVEGGRGWSDDQLIALGAKLGISSSDFADAVRTGRHDSLVRDVFRKAGETPHLQADNNGQKVFVGTPTIANGTTVLDIGDPGWLTALTG